MPKKDNEDKESGGSFVGFLIVLIFILIWLSVFALLIKFDAGNLGTTLRPYIKDVPVLNLILPKVPDEQIQEENDYPYKNLKEAIAAIKELKEQIEALTEANDALSQKVAELTAENNRLSIYEDNYLDFMERVKRFEEYVVFNNKAPELSEYLKFYEALYPENAERIYQYVLELSQFDEGIKTQAAILAGMKPSQAAQALEQMTADIEWITQVMLAMKTTQATEILNKMEPLYVAKILQRMSDLNAEKYQALYKELYRDYQPQGTN